MGTNNHEPIALVLLATPSNISKVTLHDPALTTLTASFGDLTRPPFVEAKMKNELTSYER